MRSNFLIFAGIILLGGCSTDVQPSSPVFYRNAGHSARVTHNGVVLQNVSEETVGSRIAEPVRKVNRHIKETTKGVARPLSQTVRQRQPKVTAKGAHFVVKPSLKNEGSPNKLVVEEKHSPVKPSRTLENQTDKFIKPGQMTKEQADKLLKAGIISQEEYSKKVVR